MSPLTRRSSAPALRYGAIVAVNVAVMLAFLTLDCSGIQVAGPRLGDPCGADQPCDEGRCVEKVCVDFGGDHCLTAAHCDDGDPTTRDSCRRGSCRHEKDDGADEAGCVPRCAGRACGDDGCGGTCGTCAEGSACGASGRCIPAGLGACDPAICPALPGFHPVCNDAGHCEYAWRDPAVPGRRGERVIWVPPGEFTMGSDDDAGERRERPGHPVGFSDGYWIDRSPATAAEFATFLNTRRSNDCGAGDCVDPLSPTANVRWDEAAKRAAVATTCQAAPRADATTSCAPHPAVEVTWFGARAYCAAKDARLCSEAEWERAARGAKGHRYPWGATAPSPEHANCGEGLCRDGFERTAPTGRFAAGRSPVGCDDMAGGVWEWVEDDWHPSYEDDGRPDDGSPWVDAGDGGERGKERVLRGGSFEHGTADYLRTTQRFFDGPGYSGVTGVRCCRSK